MDFHGFTVDKMTDFHGHFMDLDGDEMDEWESQDRQLALNMLGGSLGGFLLWKHLSVHMVGLCVPPAQLHHSAHSLQICEVKMNHKILGNYIQHTYYKVINF